MKGVKFTSLLLMLTFTAVAMSGCLLLPAEEEVLEPPLVEPSEITYATEEVQRGDLEKTLTVTGNFVAVNQTRCYYEFSGGKLDAIQVNLGQEVKAGDVLATLKTDDLETDVQIQQLMVEKAELAYENASWANRENAHIDLEIAQINLAKMQKTLDDSTLKAPIDGKISYIDTDLSSGDTVVPYTTIVQIVDMNSLVLQYSDSNYKSFVLGMELTAKINNTEYKATVEMTPDSAPLDMADSMKNCVRFSLEGFDYSTVSSGATATLTLTIDKRTDVLYVRSSLISNYQGRRYVTVLDESGNKIEKDVEVGLETSTYSEIISGLEEGELIIVP